jgi:hypothetical protein
VIYGAETPPRSRAEMEALAALASEASGQRGDSKVRAPDTRPEPGSSAQAALPGIRGVRLPRGKLAVHEEFSDATAEAVDAFLGEPGATHSGAKR